MSQYDLDDVSNLKFWQGLDSSILKSEILYRKRMVIKCDVHSCLRGDDVARERGDRGDAIKTFGSSWKLLKLAIAMTIVNWITAKKSKIQDATLWTQFNSPMQSIDWLLLPISWFKIQITNERTSSNSRGEHCLAKNCAMNATGFSGRFFKTSLTTWPEIQNKLHEAQKTKLKFTIYTSKLQLKNSLQMNWNAQYLPCNIHCHLLVLRRTCISFSSQ